MQNGACIQCDPGWYCDGENRNRCLLGDSMLCCRKTDVERHVYVKIGNLNFNLLKNMLMYIYTL